MNVRRVVTGHTPEGKAVVARELRDAPAAASLRGRASTYRLPALRRRFPLAGLDEHRAWDTVRAAAGGRQGYAAIGATGHVARLARQAGA